MTKTLSIAALFLAVSVAATASLLKEPVPRDDQGASVASTAQEITRRGTRDPLTAVADAELAVGDQPRRGQRSDLALADNAMPPLATDDGIRRGTR